MVTLTKDAVEDRTIAHGAFLDIEGAFERTLFKVIQKAVEQHGIGHTICWWIGSMLVSRKITATLAGEALKGSVANGYLQCRGKGGTFYQLCSGASLLANSQQDSKLEWFACTETCR